MADGLNTNAQQGAMDKVQESLQAVENVLKLSLDTKISKSPAVCALMSGFNKMASNIMKVFGKKDQAEKYSKQAEQYSKQATKLGVNAKTMEAMREGAFKEFAGVVQERQQSAIKIQSLVRGVQSRHRTAKASKATPSTGQDRGQSSGRGGGRG